MRSFVPVRTAPGVKEASSSHSPSPAPGLVRGPLTDRLVGSIERSLDTGPRTVASYLSA